MTTTICCVPLYERTLELVRNAPRHITQRMMAEKCERSEVWLSRFKAGKCPDASIRTVQCLHDYLLNVGTDAA